MYMLNIFS